MAERVIDTQGLSLGEVIEKLKQSPDRVKTEFNGVWLSSDMSEDAMYVALTGKTKAELAIMRQEHLKEQKQKEADLKAKLPERIAEYKEKGKKYIPEQKLGVWAGIVEDSLKKGIYDGSDLAAVLALLPYISGEKWGKAKAIFRLQAHSGCSAAVVFAELRKLLDGTNVDVEEFIAYISG